MPAATPQFRGSPHRNGLQPAQRANNRFEGNTMRPAPRSVCHPALGHAVLLAYLAYLHDRLAPAGSLLDLRAHLELGPGVGKLVRAAPVLRERLLALRLGQPLNLLLVLGNRLPRSSFLPLAIPVDPLQGVRKLPLFLRLLGYCIGLGLPTFLHSLLRSNDRRSHRRCLMTLFGGRAAAEGLMRPFELDRRDERGRKFVLEKNSGQLPTDACADGEDCRRNAGSPEPAHHACAAHFEFSGCDSRFRNDLRGLINIKLGIFIQTAAGIRNSPLFCIWLHVLYATHIPQ